MASGPSNTPRKSHRSRASRRQHSRQAIQRLPISREMEFRERLAAREVFSKTACEKNRLLPSPLAPSLAAACRPDPTRSSNRPEQTRGRPADSAISRLVWILVRRPRYSAPYPYRIIGRKTEGYPAPIFPIKQAFIGSFLSHDQERSPKLTIRTSSKSGR